MHVLLGLGNSVPRNILKRNSCKCSSGNMYKKFTALFLLESSWKKHKMSITRERTSQLVYSHNGTSYKLYNNCRFAKPCGSIQQQSIAWKSLRRRTVAWHHLYNVKWNNYEKYLFKDFKDVFILQLYFLKATEWWTQIFILGVTSGGNKQKFWIGNM